MGCPDRLDRDGGWRLRTPHDLARARCGTGRAAAETAAGAAEQHFPVPIVALHGLLAVTTALVVLLAALGVG
jgi:hypothetical protein